MGGGRGRREGQVGGWGGRRLKGEEVECVSECAEMWRENLGEERRGSLGECVNGELGIGERSDG